MKLVIIGGQRGTSKRGDARIKHETYISTVQLALCKINGHLYRRHDIFRIERVIARRGLCLNNDRHSISIRIAHSYCSCYCREDNKRQLLVDCWITLADRYQYLHMDNPAVVRYTDMAHLRCDGSNDFVDNNIG